MINSPSFEITSIGETYNFNFIISFKKGSFKLADQIQLLTVNSSFILLQSSKAGRGKASKSF